MTLPGPEITERDRVILRSIAEYRLLTTEQVQRLHFPSLQTAQRRLRRLEGAGLVRRDRTPSLATLAVVLTPRGATMVRNDPIKEFDGSDGHHRQARLPGDFFLRHMVAVNDFRVAVEVACRDRPDVELLGFVSDTTRTSAGPGVQPRAALTESVTFGPGQGERLVHVPDAAFALRRGDRQALFIVKVDRGTEVVGDPKRGVGLLVRFYLRALVCGAFQGLGARLGRGVGFQGFRVLVVTTSQARIATIRDRWGTMPTEPEHAKRFIWLSVTGALSTDQLLEHPWTSLDARDPESYMIAPPREGGLR